MITNTNFTPMNNKQSFCGKFRSNDLLLQSLKCASPRDLYEFSQNLKRMKAKKDKRVFWLSENWNTTPYSVLVKTHAIQLNNKFCEKTITKSVGIEAILHSRNYSLACYKDVIKNINIALKNIYPDKSV